MWLLLIEDEQHLAGSLQRGLTEEGYTVDVAYDGEDGFLRGLANAYDVMVVDWRVPRKDGRTVVRQWRAQGCATPVLMLTALGGVDHRVAGLDAGADDYLTKPFAFEELLARLRALTRRAQTTAVSPSRLAQGVLVMDTARRTVRVRETAIDLRPKEFALLETLLRQPGQVVSRTRLAECVWGSALYVSDNVIDVSMSRLRHKLAEAVGDAASGSVSVETVRGVGYRIVGEGGG